MNDEQAILQMLDSWATLNKDVGKLREDQIKSLINYEVSTKRRPVMIDRLHQRFAKLRSKRERLELKAGGLL